MERYLSVILLTAAAFLAVVTSLAAKRKYAARMTGISLTLAGIGGLILYGYGSAFSAESLPLAVLRALLNTCYMFLGRNNFALLKDTPLCVGEAGQFLFWAVHFLALYATAGAVIITVGTKILKKLRMAISRRHDLVLIYGVDDDTVTFGSGLLEKNQHVLFIDDNERDGLGNRIVSAGSVLLSDNNACKPDEAFLKSIGIGHGSRKITLYALQADSAKNIDFAVSMVEALEKRGVTPDQTALVISGVREEDGSWLLAGSSHYGYGNVFAFDRAQLAARLLIQRYPPCNTLSFSEDGLAQQNFEALIVGFGKCGQAVLHQIVANGQFEGSTFKLSVFSPDCHQVDGLLYAGCPEAMDNYGIEFYEADARSREMYHFLARNAATLKYVVVACGTEKTNREIRIEIQKELRRLHSTAEIYECSRSGVSYSSGVGRPIEKHPVFSPESLDIDRMDAMAAALNQCYSEGNGKSLRENWAECNYFNRLSSRASADFYPAILRAAGKTAEEARKDWDLPEKLLQNLGKTEHLRWCAFHYMNGFRSMPEEVYLKRAGKYREAVEKGEPAPFKVGKDMEQRFHACLVPWDRLKDLSEYESRLTGKTVDYQKMDIDNTLLVPKLLELSAETGVVK